MIVIQYYGMYKSSMVLPPVLRSQVLSQVLLLHTLYGRALNMLYKNMYDDSKRCERDIDDHVYESADYWHFLCD